MKTYNNNPIIAADLTRNLFLLLLAVITVSCGKDFLNSRPEATIAVEGIDYSKSENTFMPVSAAYASMRTNNAYGMGYLASFEVAADDADKGMIPSDGSLVQEFDGWTLTSSNDLLNQLWIGYYSIVDAANFAIDEMPKYEAAQPSEENKLYSRQYAGEAKVIRAFAYFSLVRLFGYINLPLRSDYTALERAALPQVTPAQVYAQIKKDLKEAIDVLPPSYGKGWDGRINGYTALGIKAKVHLYMNELDSAALYAGMLISSGRYSLLPSFRDEFRSVGENSRESVFELQYSMLGRTNGEAALPNDPYAFLQGPRSNTPSNMQGWGLCVPSLALRNFFASRGETIRAEVTFMKSDTVFEGSFITRGKDCPEYYNGKVFSPPSENTWAFNGYSRDYNIRLLRYADILLIYAEALVRGGVDINGASSADVALNMVRSRAQLNDTAATLEIILDERRAELAMEEDRFFDLVRQGKAGTVLGLDTKFASSGGFQGYYPIPVKQMQLNTNLEQNQNYK
jgi:hypothetical protein